MSQNLLEKEERCIEKILALGKAGVERNMKISYDPTVDALYIRFLDEPMECEVIRLNNQVAVNIGPGEKIVGIEVLDASEILEGIKDQKVQLENLIAEPCT